MSRLAIRNLLRPARLHLDIGCARLILQSGKSATRHKLALPLKPGIPNNETLAELRAALVSLCSTQPAGKRTLEISLSDSVARSWIVERLPGLASLQEIEALASDQMQNLYGDSDVDATEWVIRLDATPFATQWPAIALPKALLDLLIEIATSQDWQLGKIQTRFVRSFNAQRSHPFSHTKLAVFSLETSDGLTIGIRNAQEWLALRTHPPLALLGTPLPAMLRRDCRAAGLSLDECRIQTLNWSATERST